MKWKEINEIKEVIQIGDVNLVTLFPTLQAVAIVSDRMLSSVRKWRHYAMFA